MDGHTQKHIHAHEGLSTLSEPASLPQASYIVKTP